MKPDKAYEFVQEKIAAFIKEQKEKGITIEPGEVSLGDSKTQPAGHGTIMVTYTVK